VSPCVFISHLCTAAPRRLLSTLSYKSLLALGSVVVEVETDDGTTGVGVSIGGEPACYIIEHHLSRFVEGQDPR
jgi:L-alanine-DL-glutamate epimerase-like enolase superfamily enzyme